MIDIKIGMTMARKRATLENPSSGHGL